MEQGIRAATAFNSMGLTEVAECGTQLFFSSPTDFEWIPPTYGYLIALHKIIYSYNVLYTFIENI